MFDCVGPLTALVVVVTDGYFVLCFRDVASGFQPRKKFDVVGRTMEM